MGFKGFHDNIQSGELCNDEQKTLRPVETSKHGIRLSLPSTKQTESQDRDSDSRQNK